MSQRRDRSRLVLLIEVGMKLPNAELKAARVVPLPPWLILNVGPK